MPRQSEILWPPATQLEREVQQSQREARRRQAAKRRENRREWITETLAALFIVSCGLFTCLFLATL